MKECNKQEQCAKGMENKAPMITDMAQEPQVASSRSRVADQPKYPKKKS